jgi:hypothetical protein
MWSDVVDRARSASLMARSERPRPTIEEDQMSKESDWHIFDKACDITAMAVKGAAEGESVTPAYVAELFREVHRALTDTANAMENAQQRAGF